MATVNDVYSLAAISSDLCDDTDANLLHILSAPKVYCKCVANNINKHLVSRDQNCMDRSIFRSPKNESALVGTNRLVKDRSQKSGSIPERSLTKLTRFISTVGGGYYLQLISSKSVQHSYESKEILTLSRNIGTTRHYQ